MGMIIYGFVLLLFVGFPLLLTGMNLFHLFAGSKKMRDLCDYATISAGVLFTILLYCAWDTKSWQTQLRVSADFSFHEPIAGVHLLTILFFAVAAVAGYLILRIKKERPPLVILLCLSAMYIGCGIGIVFVIQLFPNLPDASILLRPFEGYMMCLFPLNFIILTISLIRDIVKNTELPAYQYRSKFLNFLSRFLGAGKWLPLWAFLGIFPFLGISLAILLLFGQRPDSLIKAFTETSDWLFSTKISPPPIEDGHYLCTVAAKGHKKLVKPCRTGIRHGYRIVVNRQLCIANAFEELVAERLPRLHHFIRKTYDTYGYPLSKHIKTPLAADIIYLFMKPLEWFFLMILYLFDIRPENRIAKQYLLTSEKEV